MTQYNSLNTVSDSQLNELKLAAKNATGVSLRFSSNMVGTDNDIKFYINYY